MQTIHRDDLRSVIGGAGADMLGSLLGSAGPILNGVASIIAASKSGGAAQQGADPSQAAAQQQAPQGPPPGAEAAAAAQQAASPGFAPHHRPRVSVTVKSF